LPRSRLPHNVFEPRYLNMIDDALSGDRLIGMIQPEPGSANQLVPTLFKVGCVGRIISLAEEGNRYLIALTGICRFAVAEELPTTRGYRRIVPEWSAFRGDFLEGPGQEIDRKRLTAGLKSFFKANGLSADWASIEQAPDERLVNSLAMICPFPPAEKQALLEAATLADRVAILTGLVEMAVIGGTPDDNGARH
jgi:Lon protease-like protein